MTSSQLACQIIRYRRGHEAWTFLKFVSTTANVAFITSGVTFIFIFILLLYMILRADYYDNAIILAMILCENCGVAIQT